ncbi:MAG: WG repeat-containing protein [Flammeovirgaceae bacterium]
MNKHICILLLAILFACSPNTDSSKPKKSVPTPAADDPFLIRVENEDTGLQGYVNSKGDTVIAMGKYDYCFTDTFKTFAIVASQEGLIGINRKEKRLFEVFVYDNGPDYVQEGLFRMVKDGKIGFANMDGKVVIDPQYPCAYAFQDGKAKVALECTSKQDGEYSFWESETWFFIDKQGEKVE